MLVTLTIVQATGARWFRIKVMRVSIWLNIVLDRCTRKLLSNPNRKTTTTTFLCALSLKHVSAFYFHIFMAKRKKNLVTVAVFVRKYSWKRKGKKWAKNYVSLDNKIFWQLKCHFLDASHQRSISSKLRECSITWYKKNN